MFVNGKVLGQNVGNIVVSRGPFESDLAVDGGLADEVVSNVDVLGLRVLNRVLGESDGGFVVAEDDEWRRDRAEGGGVEVGKKQSEPDSVLGRLP